jgi:hypothetical protein
MDTERVYHAVHATNQPNWREKKLIFAGEHLLEDGEYVIVEGTLFAEHEDFTKLVAKGAYSSDDYGITCCYCDGHNENYDSDSVKHEQTCPTELAKALI